MAADRPADPLLAWWTACHGRRVLEQWDLWPVLTPGQFRVWFTGTFGLVEPRPEGGEQMDVTGQMVRVKQGQFLSSERHLAETAKVGRQVARGAIRLLTGGDDPCWRVTPRGARRLSLFSVLKFQAYAPGGGQGNPRPNPSAGGENHSDSAVTTTAVIDEPTQEPPTRVIPDRINGQLGLSQTGLQLYETKRDRRARDPRTTTTDQVALLRSTTEQLMKVGGVLPAEVAGKWDAWYRATTRLVEKLGYEPAELVQVYRWALEHSAGEEHWPCHWVTVPSDLERSYNGSPRFYDVIRKKMQTAEAREERAEDVLPAKE